MSGLCQKPLPVSAVIAEGESWAVGDTDKCPASTPQSEKEEEREKEA